MSLSPASPSPFNLLPGMPEAVDLFAGCGGMSEGAELAGVRVVWAGNHWPLAVKVHADNHPGAVHLCQDLHQADWRTVPAHDLLLAAPACQGHTKARGKERPSHDATRSTAWAVVSALEYHRPAVALIENVPAFLKWALYPAWSEAVRLLGYALSPHIVDAADCGVPQHRERLVLVLTRSKHPLRLKLETQEHRPVAEVINFEAPAASWSKIERPGRASKTLARVARGRASFGDRFVMPYYGRGSGDTGRSLQRPIGTLTTRDRWAVVDGDRMRMVNKFEARAIQGFRPTYLLPANHADAIFMLGNSVPPPLATTVIRALRAA